MKKEDTRMEKTTPTTIRIPETLKHDLEILAKNDNRSLNNLINIILQTYVRQHIPDKEEE